MRERGLYFLLHMCPWVCLAARVLTGVIWKGPEWFCSGFVIQISRMGSKPAWLCPRGRHCLTVLPSALGGNTVPVFQSSVHCTNIFEEIVCNKRALHASACKPYWDVWDLLRIVSQHLADSGTHKPFRLKINFSLGLSEIFAATSYSFSTYIRKT